MQVTLDPADLLPVIKATIAETVSALLDEQSAMGDRLAYSEAEAARLYGWPRHKMRDLRLRGEISFSTGPARSIIYSRADLLGYLAKTRTAARV